MAAQDESILVQQGLDEAFGGAGSMLATMSDRDKKLILDKAHSAIILCLGDKVLWEVSKEKSATEVWMKLESLYVMKSLANHLFLKQRLYSFKMASGRSIEDHIDDFHKLILDLENIEVKVNDDDQTLILLSSLPDSYEHLVDTLLYEKESLTSEEVQVTLMSKELKQRKTAKQK